MEPHGEEKWEPRGNSSEAPIVVAARKVGLTENVSGGSQDPKDTVVIHHEIQRFLGGGFKHFLSYPYLGKIPILTIFQRGWNHQLEVFFEPKRNRGEKSLFCWKDEKTKHLYKWIEILGVPKFRSNGWASTETPEIQEGRHFLTKMTWGQFWSDRSDHFFTSIGRALLGCPRKLVFNA